VGETLFLGGYAEFARNMTSSQYFLSVLPSATLIHSWVPVRPSEQDYLVNGPSWTVMTLIWVWLLYPVAAALLLRLPDSHVHIALGACVVACFVPFTFLQPWAHPPRLIAGTNAKATAFNLLYEWPPFIAPRFLSGVATAECFRRRHALVPRYVSAWWEPLISDAALLAAFSAAALVPYTGDQRPTCRLRKGSLAGPCLLWEPEDPGFGHRAPRLGFEVLFDVVLIPLWLVVFYYGGFETEGGCTGPVMWVCRLPVMAYLGRWVWGMYIFREPVHILILLVLPPKIRCGLQGLRRCIALDPDGHPRILYTGFSDLQPTAWVTYVVALTAVSAVLTEFVDKYVSAAVMKLAPEMPKSIHEPKPIHDKARPSLAARGLGAPGGGTGATSERCSLLAGRVGGGEA
jgi:hypothetical protein